MIEKILAFFRKLQFLNNTKVRLFIDMDGTIADIHEYKDWYERMKNEEDFFEKLNPFTNLIVALYLIKYQYKGKIKIYTLSAVERNDRNSTAVKSKNNWLNSYASFINKKNRIYSLCGKKKTEYISPLSKKDILLDDHTPNLLDWEADGGYGIKVKNNINCSGTTWKGLIIYNQDSISSIVTKLDEIIRERL